MSFGFKTRAMKLLLTPFAFFSRRKRVTKCLILALATLVIYGALVTRRRTWIDLKLPFDSETNTLTNNYLKILSGKPMSQEENVRKPAGANAHIWDNFCPSSPQVLCHHPLFPTAPDEKMVVKSLDVSRYKNDYVQRIFGFLHPPKTGRYKFALASDDFSELWLSPSEDPTKSVVICSLSEWTTRRNFQHSRSQVSKEIELSQGRRYFIEVLHFQMGGDDFVQVAWSLPGMIQNKFETIPTHNISLFLKDNDTANDYNMAPDSPACTSRPSHRHTYSLLNTDAKNLPHQAVADVLPHCVYKPSYLTIKETPEGPKKIYDFLKAHLIPIGSYPAVEYKTVTNEYPELGNHFLDMITAKKTAKMYIDTLHQRYPGKFKVLKLVNVERKVDQKLGSRFFMEFIVNVTGQKELAMLSESVFWPKGSDALCYPKGFQWNRNAKIALVITLKNQGRWMIHFLNNLQEMYAPTKDDKVGLVIFNYNNSDINLQHELAIRELPPTTVINHEAEFYSRTKSFNRAVEQIQDPQTIIFTLDLHLELPPTLFDDIRKHCFEGRSVYTPLIIRLDCGETPETLKGRWEPLGFGLVGIYKSDWDKVGGLNEEAFDEKWGGEDWDFMERIVYFGMEYDRVRHPKIFHYFHSKNGMWNND